MLAIRQTYTDAPAVISVPKALQHNFLEVILLAPENINITYNNNSISCIDNPEIGCEAAFWLLAGLSDDFLADGRTQLPLQERDEL